MGVNECCGKFTKHEEDKKEPMPEQDKQGSRFEYEEWQPSWQHEVDGEDDKPYNNLEVKDNESVAINNIVDGMLPLEYQDGYTPTQSRVIDPEESKVDQQILFHALGESNKESKKAIDLTKFVCQSSVVDITYIRRPENK